MESADDGAIAELNTSAQEDEQRDEADEVKHRVPCVTPARAFLLADALRFIVPH